MDLAEPAPTDLPWLARLAEGKTDGTGTSIPCRALVYQEAPGPPVSGLSMFLLEPQCRSSLWTRRRTSSDHSRKVARERSRIDTIPATFSRSITGRCRKWPASMISRACSTDASGSTVTGFRVIHWATGWLDAETSWDIARTRSRSVKIPSNLPFSIASTAPTPCIPMTVTAAATEVEGSTVISSVVITFRTAVMSVPAAIMRADRTRDRWPGTRRRWTTRLARELRSQGRLIHRRGVSVGTDSDRDKHASLSVA